ncbi:transposase family protein [Pseudonocardia nantongensis]|uniref:transposase family protein n=1 Tax=Pseudonocardia nantongensis TaxID=1181885 RepID=UPI00397B9D33
MQFIADSIGRLVWISPPLPGVRHDMGTARDYAIIKTLTAHEIPVVADTAYQGADPRVAVPRRRRRLDPGTGRYRRLARNQKEVNAAHARRRGPGSAIGPPATTRPGTRTILGPLIGQFRPSGDPR